MTDKFQVDEYINGTADISPAAPAQRHMSMLNFLIGYNLPVAIKLVEWHRATYPYETLESCEFGCMPIDHGEDQ